MITAMEEHHRPVYREIDAKRKKYILLNYINKVISQKWINKCNVKKFGNAPEFKNLNQRCG